uniref:Uncharacterized protein n=1 Tax=viral metagenome TaxID=1070528 RepID=A0A6C0LR55_9ZZZZ
MEIKVKGERKYDKCYFRMKDIMDGFDIKNLYTMDINNIHYKYFYSEKLGDPKKRQ